MEEGPVQNPQLLLPRWHGFFTRDDLQEAFRIRAESYYALGADECIAITLNPEEFLWPEEEAAQFNDAEMTNHHMYFRVMTEQQWEALKQRSEARLTNKWWGYKMGGQAEEKQGVAALKTERKNIRDSDKIKVNTWVVAGKLRRRVRYMVDPVSYESRTHDALPMPRIVILQWMNFPMEGRLVRPSKLNELPPAPTPRGMDDRGPLPPHVPPPGPQDEGEPEGQWIPGGNNDQEEEHQLDGSIGTEDMLFVKGKLEALVINYYNLEQQMAAISGRYVCYDELIERAPLVLDELSSLKGNLESIGKNHDLLEHKMVTISTGLLSLMELIEKAPEVVNELCSLKANLESLALKHDLLEEHMVITSTGLLSVLELIKKAPQAINDVFILKGNLESVAMNQVRLAEQMTTMSARLFSIEELIEKMPQVDNEVFCLKDELDCVAINQMNLEKKLDTLSSRFLSSEDKLAFLMEKTVTLEEKMASLSSSSLSCKTKAAPPSNGDGNPIGVSLKKPISIIGMRKAKGNKEIGLTLSKVKTDLKKEIAAMKNMMSSNRKETVLFTLPVPGNVCEREVVPEDEREVVPEDVGKEDTLHAP